jgi:hypothetical protein
MTTRTQRRVTMLILFIGGPLVGYLLRGDRGLLFGLIVSLLAVVWYLIEERKLL